jgi:methylated-DNA-[protein]-cysteine S-methyltransferase
MSMATMYTTVDSPLGELLLVGEESVSGGTALVSVSVPGQKRGAVVVEGWRREPTLFAEAAGQLRAYFARELKEFDLPLAERGTEFQRRVWAALDAIPYGTTTTYGAVAETIGVPRAGVRAVGGAIGANPLLVVRPCHRVVGANGSLTGYAGGLERKRQLMALESGAPESA